MAKRSPKERWNLQPPGGWYGDYLWECGNLQMKMKANIMGRWYESPYEQWGGAQQEDKPILSSGKASDHRDFKRLKELELEDREQSKPFQVFPVFQDYGTFSLPNPGSQEVSGAPEQSQLWREVTRLRTPQLGHGGESKSRRWQWREEHQTLWHWVWWTQSHHRGETGFRGEILAIHSTCSNKCSPRNLVLLPTVE